MVIETGSSITMHSLQSQFFFDKNTCKLNMYDKRLFSQGSNPILSDMEWKIEEADFRADPRLGIWNDVFQNTRSCSVNTFTDSFGAFHLESVKQDSNGMIVLKLVKEEGKALKREMSFRHFDPLKQTSKFGFGEDFKVSNVSEILVNNLSVDPLSFSNLLVVERGELLFNDIIFVTPNGNLKFDFTQGLNEFSFYTLQKIGNDIHVSVKYRDNSNIILNDRDTVNDPTFGFTGGTNYRVITGTGSGSSCPSPSSVSTNDRVLLPTSSETGAGCQAVATEWDITSLPAGLTVTDTNIRFTPGALQNALNCNYYEINNQPSGASASALYTDIFDGTLFLGNDSQCTTASSQTIDLGSNADSDVEAQEPSGWWSVGISLEPFTRDSVRHRMDVGTVELEVVYTAGGGGTHTWNATGELGLDDSLSFTSGLVWNVTDELGLDDSLSFMSGLVWNVTDELGLDDSVLFQSNVFTDSDSLGLDDSFEFILTKQQFNAIKLYLNFARNGTLGGVFAGACDYQNNYTMIGFYENGTLICHKFN